MNEMRNDELPNGWASAAVGQLGHVQLGKMLDRAKNKGTPLAYLRNINVRWFGFNLDDLKTVLVSEDERERFSVRDGDLFICEGGEPGRSAVWKGGKNNLVYQKALHRFRTNGAIVPEMLLYHLRLEAEAGSLHESFSGSTIKHFTREALVKYQVPLPPLAEQKRIADKLELVLGRVDACRARLDRVPALLKRFRQSVLAAATSGRLTEEWRMTNGVNDEWEDGFPNGKLPTEAPDIPDTWKWVPVGILATKVTDGVHKKPNYVNRGIPFLTVKSLTAGKGISFDVNNFVSPQDHEEFCKRTKPEKGDLLVTKDGTLGVVRLIDTDRVFSIFVSLALIKPKDHRMSQYLLFALQAPVVQKQMVGVGTGLQHIHLRDLREDVIPLPPLPEQQEIVRRVEALFAFSDRIEARLATAQKTVERLTPATLAKAFRGELVPQDPNDEPASVLLERIAATREAPPAKSKLKMQRVAKR